MSGESFTFKGANGREVSTWLWSTSFAKPAGIVQIFHGVAEHAFRYADFAEYLNGRGFTVYASDHRGHGRTGEINNDLRHVDTDGFNGIIQDQHILSEMIRKEHPDIPLFILGHSLGSFLAQEYIKRYAAEISGVIMTGSGLMQGLDIKIGLILSSIMLLFGIRRPNRLLDRLTLGSNSIPGRSGKFSWLSRDEEQVKMYENDPFCGIVMSNGYFYCFFKGLDGLYDKAGLDRIPKDLSICILSGANDPVGKFGSRIGKLSDLYRGLGISDIKFKLYEGARHEILNETNRSEVYRDISQWLELHAQ